LPKLLRTIAGAAGRPGHHHTDPIIAIYPETTAPRTTHPPTFHSIDRDRFAICMHACMPTIFSYRCMLLHFFFALPPSIISPFFLNNLPIP
jgi:hypothetical protein